MMTLQEWEARYEAHNLKRQFRTLANSKEFCISTT